MRPTPKIPGGPYVMGVLNATPDSFSDGGRWALRQAACDHAMAMIEAGADLIDVGGESTRPGAIPVGAEEEIERTTPLIEAIRARAGIWISIDTMKPDVARTAFAAGASMWNDVTGLSGQDAPSVAADLGGDVVLMHMQGLPRTMQADPRYHDVVSDVIAALRARVRVAVDAGVASERIWVDPGIGFGKNLAHNLSLIRALRRLREETGQRMVFGASRKSFIAKIDPGAGPQARLGASIAAALIAARSGADMVRVHDVRETVQALKLERAVDG